MHNYRFEDIAENLEESFSVTLTQKMMDLFLEISGDCNPLHTDDDYALSQGFKGKVVYGMLTSSLYSTLVGVYLPGRLCLLQSIDIQFTKPVFIGDVLTVSGRVGYINEAFRRVEIKAVITNQDNIKISKATINVGIRDEQ